MLCLGYRTSFFEYTEVCTKDVMHPVSHLLAATEHAPYPNIPPPDALTREEKYFT